MSGSARRSGRAIREPVDVYPLAEVVPIGADWPSALKAHGLARVVAGVEQVRGGAVEPAGRAFNWCYVVAAQAGVECVHGCLLFRQVAAEAPARCSRTVRGRFTLSTRPYALCSATYRHVAVYSASVQVRYLVTMDAPDIDYRGELPPHRQIAAWLTARIQSGDLQPGQPVPSEKELTDTFGVARTTARRAIAYLRDEGIIRTVAGRGSYVN
jgi:GntR family transcriptional regulator